MTVFIDPVIGAALVAGLLPILPGLPCLTNQQENKRP